MGYSFVPYTKEWPETYKREAALIRRILGDELIYIEHVGGTAVVGLHGRPIIDIMATVHDLAAIDRYDLALKAAGYEPAADVAIPHARGFKKDFVVDLYLFPDEHPRMMEMIDHRDYLRAHPDEAAKFQELKMKLSKKFAHDYASYQEQKEVLLKELTRKAARWRGREADDDRGTV